MQVFPGEGDNAKPVYNIFVADDSRHIPTPPEPDAVMLRGQAKGRLNHPLLDDDGYPKYDIVHTGNISFTPQTKHHDKYAWTIEDDATFRKFFVQTVSREFFIKLRNQTLLLPNVSNAVGGRC